MNNNNFHKDNLVNIFCHLSDKDKIRFLSTCKILHRLKKIFNYGELVDLENILHLSYRKAFINICINEFLEFFDHNIRIKIDKNYLSGVKKITFGSRFNRSIKGCIPESVTHLTLGFLFDQEITDSIPNSVTHLSFGEYFQRNIDNCIPTSVKFLKIHKRYKKNISSNKNMLGIKITYID